MRSLLIGLVSAAALSGSMWYALGFANTAPAIVCTWLGGVTVITFAMFAFDKRQAVKLGRRVPESTLLTLAAAGGSLGAYAGMETFRHKTIKRDFRTLFWLIVFAQAVLIAWWVKSSFWAD